MYKRIQALADKPVAAPEETPEDDIDDETLLEGLREYLNEKYGVDEKNKGPREVFKCTLCSGRSFESEEAIEMHTRTDGHVRNEIAYLKRHVEAMDEKCGQAESVSQKSKKSKKLASKPTEAAVVPGKQTDSTERKQTRKRKAEAEE